MKQRRSAWEIRADRQAAKLIRRDAHGRVYAADRERFEALNPAPKPAPIKQQQLKRRTNNVTKNDRNPLRGPENMTKEEAHAYRAQTRWVAEQIALWKINHGEMSVEEGKKIGKLLLREELADMSDADFDALRSDKPRWEKFETAMRDMPDNISSDEYEGQMDAAARKFVSQVTTQAWFDGKISEDHALEALRDTIPVDHIEGNDLVKLAAIALDIHSPKEYDQGNAKFEPPKPRQLPETASEADMKPFYAPMDDRTNSPAARERRREAAQAAKDAESFKAAKAEKELTEAKHSNKALTRLRRLPPRPRLTLKPPSMTPSTAAATAKVAQHER